MIPSPTVMAVSKPGWQNIGLLFLRVMLGVGMARHGFNKIFLRDMDAFAAGVSNMGLPMPLVLAWAAALSEFAGGICVALGAWTRTAAFFIFATMTVAAFVRHGGDPLAKKELALAYWTMAGAVVLIGPGGLSLEAMRRKVRSRSFKKPVKFSPKSP